MKLSISLLLALLILLPAISFLLQNEESKKPTRPQKQQIPPNTQKEIHPIAPALKTKPLVLKAKKEEYLKIISIADLQSKLELADKESGTAEDSVRRILEMTTRLDPQMPLIHRLIGIIVRKLEDICQQNIRCWKILEEAYHLEENLTARRVLAGLMNSGLSQAKYNFKKMSKRHQAIFFETDNNSLKAMLLRCVARLGDGRAANEMIDECLDKWSLNGSPDSLSLALLGWNSTLKNEQGLEDYNPRSGIDMKHWHRNNLSSGRGSEATLKHISTQVFRLAKENIEQLTETEVFSLLEFAQDKGELEKELLGLFEAKRKKFTSN